MFRGAVFSGHGVSARPLWQQDASDWRHSRNTFDKVVKIIGPSFVIVVSDFVASDFVVSDFVAAR